MFTGIFNVDFSHMRLCGYRDRTKYTLPKSRHSVAYLAVVGLLVAAPIQAAVSDLEVVGVTPTAFSVVWFSDEPISSSSLKVFNDIAGNDEITSGLTIVSESADVTGTHSLGLAMVTVIGMTPNQTVFVQTLTDGASGLVAEPAPGALLEVTAQNAVTRTTPVGGLITNDIVEVSVNNPTNETDPLDGALTILEVVDAAGAAETYRLGALQGRDGGPTAFLNLNNLFATTTNETTATSDGSIVRLTQYRGLACSDVENQKNISFGRIPRHEETFPITELESLVECFISDRVCDDVVNIQDVQFILNAFGETVGRCAFSPYLDVSPDDEINILDVQAVLNNFGDSAPF